MFILTLNAQVLRHSAAAEYTAFGVYTKKHIDGFSFTGNPASLSSVKNVSVGMYAERKFLLQELSDYKVVFNLPVTVGAFGLFADHSGSAAYGETSLELSYGRSLGNKADIGVGFSYHMINISGYGKASAICPDIGILIHLSEKLHAGFHMSNPVAGKFGTDKQEKLASVYCFGTGYDASDKFSFYMEVEKEEDQPVNVHAGFQYKIIPLLLTRMGIASATSSLWIGVGLLRDAWRLDITASYHPQLGLTPGILFLFNLKKEKH